MINIEHLRYQQAALTRVSRTFALTIPQLPAELRDVVANAYLVCRLADTIEDDPGLETGAKAEFMAAFIDILRGTGDPSAFADRLGASLSDTASSGERDLVRHTGTVLAITRELPAVARLAVARCVTAMADGMAEFQHQASLAGLPTVRDLHRYCYCVAGVVGEMLTELFCARCPEMARERRTLMNLAVRFGEGLQLTNILKDLWEDRDANACWLPRSVFADVPGGMEGALRRGDAGALTAGIRFLLGVAHGHLLAAIDYVALIPKREHGIRRFCLWAIGMALLTLRRIHRNPGYRNAAQVRITRGAVRATMLACDAAAPSNHLLRILFSTVAAGLPCTDDHERDPPAGTWLAPDLPP